MTQKLSRFYACCSRAWLPSRITACLSSSAGSGSMFRIDRAQSGFLLLRIFLFYSAGNHCTCMSCCTTILLLYLTLGTHYDNSSTSLLFDHKQKRNYVWTLGKGYLDSLVQGYLRLGNICTRGCAGWKFERWDKLQNVNAIWSWSNVSVEVKGYKSL
jgi:hypothetical protein